MTYNNDCAVKLSDSEFYPEGANHPTRRIEYKCPCGKGRIVEERVVGFGDYSAIIQCPDCEKSYKIIYGQGHIWELTKI